MKLACTIWAGTPTNQILGYSNAVSRLTQAVAKCALVQNQHQRSIVTVNPQCSGKGLYCCSGQDGSTLAKNPTKEQANPQSYYHFMGPHTQAYQV